MYTAGADGYIRVYDANLATGHSPFESKLIEYHDEDVTTISASVSDSQRFTLYSRWLS